MIESNRNEASRPLLGEVAIVTGASRGIGAGIALKLAQAGAKVVVNYHRQKADAEQVAAACEAAGSAALAVGADVGDETSVQNLLQAATALGSPSILVNNAGIALDKLLMDTSVEEWNQVLTTNLTGPFLCTKAILPHLLRRQWGRVINISSIWGISGAAGESAYSAAKGGLITWTKALALELASSGITVNAIAPGAVDTDMLLHLSADDKAALTEQIPARRLGSPEDIGSVAAFLASRGASYLTGQVISVNGGILT